jgi:hypothetical protein
MDIMRQASEDWGEAIRRTSPDADGMVIQHVADRIFHIATKVTADGRSVQEVGGPSAIEVGDVLVGIVPSSWVSHTAQLVQGMSIARNIIAGVMEQLLLAAQLLIWQPRCQAMVEWERSVHITGRDKRKSKVRGAARLLKQTKGKVWTIKRRALEGLCLRCSFAADEHDAGGQCPIAGRTRTEGWEFYVNGIYAVRKKDYCLEGGAWARF